MTDTDAKQWCPTMRGTMTGYEPEWLDPRDKEWHRVPMVTVDSGQGVPQPMALGGITQTIGLFGHAQAQALAWTFAAYAAEVGKDIEVKIVAYEITYEIKARKMEEVLG